MIQIRDVLLDYTQLENILPNAANSQKLLPSNSILLPHFLNFVLD